MSFEIISTPDFVRSAQPPSCTIRRGRILLKYKCRWYGVNLIKIDRFAPSSKTCCKCGHIYKGLKLSERSWTCPECGTHHDRDFNAACNIKEFGLKALPTERGKVKPVDCPLVDDRPRVLKSNGRMKQEKRGLLQSEAHAFRRG